MVSDKNLLIITPDKRKNFFMHSPGINFATRKVIGDIERRYDIIMVDWREGSAVIRRTKPGRYEITTRFDDAIDDIRKRMMHFGSDGNSIPVVTLGWSEQEHFHYHLDDMEFLVRRFWHNRIHDNDRTVALVRPLTQRCLQMQKKSMNDIEAQTKGKVELLTFPDIIAFDKALKQGGLHNNRIIDRVMFRSRSFWEGISRQNATKESIAICEEKRKSYPAWFQKTFGNMCGKLWEDYSELNTKRLLGLIRAYSHINVVETFRNCPRV